MNSKLVYLIPFVAILFWTSCKNETTTVSLGEKVDTVSENFDKQPTAENATSALEVINTEINKYKDDPAKVKSLARKAVDIAKKTNNKTSQIGYLLLLTKNYPEDPENGKNLLALADIMKGMNKNIAANVLYAGVANRFAEKNEGETAKAKLDAAAKDIDAYLKVSGEKVFENPDKYGINRRAGQSYVDACEAYALAFPNTVKAPEYLYKGTEVSRTLKTFTKSLTMYDWILDKYPQYEKAPTAMFLKGFIIENELNNAEVAKKVYEDFLVRYPDSPLKDDVNFLLENVGKSDEEIMKVIEQNRKKNK